MKIFVKVKLKASEEKVKKAPPNLFETSENYFEVFTQEPPLEGKANKRIMELLAEYFKVPVSKVKIIQGFKSKQKIVEIS